MKMFGFSWQAFAFSVLWGLGMIVAWQAWGPVTHPVVFTSVVKYSPEPVKQGGVLTVWREFEVYKPVSIVATRNMVPIGAGAEKRPTYHLPESRTLWKPGLYNNPRAHEIPEYVIPGQYRFDTVVSWEVNSFRTEARQLAPIEFTVVAK